jgi:hypothetical protein
MFAFQNCFEIYHSYSVNLPNNCHPENSKNIAFFRVSKFIEFLTNCVHNLIRLLFSLSLSIYINGNTIQIGCHYHVKSYHAFNIIKPIVVSCTGYKNVSVSCFLFEFSHLILGQNRTSFVTASTRKREKCHILLLRVYGTRSGKTGLAPHPPHSCACP